MPEKNQFEIQCKIFKGIGGFYYVKAGNFIYECRARGRFRKDGITPLVGDEVNCLIDKTSNTGMISNIMSRTNSLIRPPVANVTQIAIVVSVTNPKPNLKTVDKLISSAIYANIKPLICINKTDLQNGENLFEIYSKIGFKTLYISAESKENIDMLIEKLSGEVTVFAGNSGVGKSSLLNCILKDANLETGTVSSKIERGRHTTRHSELIPLDNNGGYIIDTPGFSSFSVSGFDEHELYKLFPEFIEYSDNCRFADCSHTVEQGCSVLEAVETGEISKSRHESYVEQYKEILDSKTF